MHLIRTRLILVVLPALAAAVIRCGGDNSPTQPVSTKLVFVAQPSPVTAGEVIAPAVQVSVQDADGNTVTSSTASVTLSIHAGTGTSGAILGGTLTRAAVSGVATFNDLTIDKAGYSYVLSATAPSLTGDISVGFIVNPGAATELAFTVQPVTVACNQPITPAAQVALQDALGNTVTGATNAVTVVLGANPGTAILSGTRTVVPILGIARFSDLQISKPEGGYTLAASAPGFPGATSASFAITGAVGLLDQQQLLYNGGTSARTLPYYTVWQSFTAAISGTLTEIDMGFFNDMSGSGQLQIFAGDGTSGPVLQTLTVPVQGITQPGVTWNSWCVYVPVLAGHQYTFNFTPDAATLPDPYGVAIGAGNPYPGGVMGLNDPSGSYRTDFDIVFRTFVKP